LTKLTKPELIAKKVALLSAIITDAVVIHNLYCKVLIARRDGDSVVFRSE